MKLFEWRRNPEVNTGNRPMNVLEQLEPYFGREDAFISMVDVPKVGIPPKTEHTSTPTGIYTYPLSSDEICKQLVNSTKTEDERQGSVLPYKHYSPYVALIIAEKTERWFCDDASEAQCDAIDEHLAHIMHQFVTPQQWKAAQAIALKKNTWRYDFAASFTYNHVWLGAAIINRKTALKAEGNADMWGYLQPADYVQYMMNTDSRRPLVWNTLWRKLGIDVLSDNGSKMIYNLEPYQTCFLTKAAIDHYGIHRNGTKTSMRGHKMLVQSAGHLFRLIHRRKLSAKMALEFLRAISEHDEVRGDSDTTYCTYNENIRLTPAQVRQTLIWLLDGPDQHEVQNLLWGHYYRKLAAFAGLNDTRN